MRMLLTGANGFVGSHILDRLVTEAVPTAILLRRGSQTSFIAPLLPRVEVRYGSLDEGASLARALADITHIIHCAGATKALARRELFEANQAGTRNLIQAANACGDQVQRIVHLSSLAAGRPGTRTCPTREGDSPAPLSAYGQSKQAGEQEFRDACRREYTILRPAGVYGPRDREFLRLFKAAAAGLTPLFGGGRQELSLVFAPDLAEVAVRTASTPEAAGRTLNVAAAEVVTARELALAVAASFPRRTVRLRLPLKTLELVCLAAAVGARLRRRPTVLAHGKHRELTAPGWVGDTTRLQAILGPVCRTRLGDGLAATLAWYRQNGWM